MNQPNYTQVPNIVIDRMSEWHGSVLKVMLAICRKTIGWHKTSDAISYSQLKEMTGLENTACAAALRGLEAAGFITIERKGGGTSRIDLNFDTSLESGEVPLQKPESTSLESGETKETPQKKLKKEDTAVTRKPASPLSKPVINFSFCDELFENIPDALVDKWQDTYPATNVERELKKMAEWLLSNPTKRKKNYRRFITNWLERSQERGGK